MKLPTPLRAITLHPWWAVAITHTDKRVEYRTRPLPAKFVGVPVALHAGASSPGERNGIRSVDPRFADAPRIVDARALGAPVDAWLAAGCPSSAFLAVVVFGGYERPRDQRFEGLVGWRIAEVHRLATPVPATGKQGWWTCTEEQREAIARGMEVKP